MGVKKGNIVQIKTGTLARTNTTKKTIFTLPANSMIVRVTLQGAASNSATSATATFENTPMNTGVAATFATVDVKTAGIETTGRQGTLSGIALNRVGFPQQISVKYAEVGAATVGGDWTALVEYI